MVVYTRLDTEPEYIIADGRHAVGDDYGFQATTIIKHTSPYCYHAMRYSE